MISSCSRSTSSRRIIAVRVRLVGFLHWRSWSESSTAVALIPHGKLFQEKGLPDPECTLVVDSGFSYTHVVPLINGSIVWNAVKRCVSTTSLSGSFAN